MNELIELLKTVRDDIDFEKEDGLISQKKLDSFDIVTIVNIISKHYSIKLGIDDLDSEHFDNASEIYKLILSKKG